MLFNDGWYMRRGGQYALWQRMARCSMADGIHSLTADSARSEADGMLFGSGRSAL